MPLTPPTGPDCMQSFLSESMTDRGQLRDWSRSADDLDDYPETFVNMTNRSTPKPENA